jgi:tetratricopeptide (TPR) repeat protein
LDSAASIAAVVYARYSGAQLMVCPAPDISRVDEAIASFRHDQQQATKMARFASRLRGMTEPISEMSDADKTAILDSMAEAGSHTETEDIPKVSLAECIKRYIFGDWRGDAMHQIELAVSANVPPKLIDAVGDRPLTAFTSGIPYTFVRNSGRDWSTKPIGHISFDGPLIVATHVWVSTQTAPKSPFAAIFDPGFFETTETRDVAAVMDRQFAYPIVFSNTVATLDGLRMASHLPLDLLFFNTHGSDDSIVLGAQTFRELKLKNESLVQWVALDSAPIVFNNSCLSWRGVGREFVRVGARGYIGTLWPVSAPKAARFAARAMGALADGASVAAAICQAELDDETRRAYIYAGLGPVRILSHAGFTERRRREYVLDVLDKLLEAMLISARILQPDENRDLARFGLREVASLFRRPELSQAETAELYALRAKQLKMLANVSHHIQRSAELDQELLGVIVETFRLAEAISKATGGQPDDFPELLWARSRIRRQVGDITGAIADLEASLRATKGIESDNLVQQVDLVELLKDAGDWKRALEIAIATKAQAENGGDREARMRLAGVLGQLERRLKNYDKSLSYVEEGYGLAMELENRPEQAEFKLDEARIQMHKKNYEAAIAATTAAGIVARACLDIGRSLASHGVMAQVLLKMGDAVASRESAERGLKVAQRMNDLYEQAGFHNDIAAAYKAEGNIQAAVKEYRDSLLLAGRIGRREMLSAFPSVSDLAVSTQDWPLIEEILSDHLAMQYRMSPEVRQASIVAFLNTLRNAVRVPPPNYARRSMLNLLDRCAYLVNSIPEDPADDIRIAGRTLQMIVAWLLGAPEAHEIARELDERWKDGGWNWGAFVVDQPPA